jgi:large subunit ribosomal protein L18
MNDRQRLRKRRQVRVRAKISGAPARPRLNVFRSLKHIYAQIIDDEAGATLASASTVEGWFRETGKTGGDIEAAGKVGQKIAERAIAAGIETVVFDRAGFPYHGRVKSLAEAAREGGLKF